MGIAPLFDDLDIDARLEYQRRLIGIAADRSSRYAGMVLELIEMRDDDGAAHMLKKVLAQTVVMKQGFSDLAKALDELPSKRAADHFKVTDTPAAREREERRLQSLAEDAEANAAAVR